MPWIPWIMTEPYETDNEEVRQLYAKTKSALTSRPADTVRLASLTPDVAGLLFDLQRAIYKGANGLSAREKEISALLVSAYNGCLH
jgi:hypothetical protein